METIGRVKVSAKAQKKDLITPLLHLVGVGVGESAHACIEDFTASLNHLFDVLRGFLHSEVLLRWSVQGSITPQFRYT